MCRFVSLSWLKGLEVAKKTKKWCGRNIMILVFRWYKNFFSGGSQVDSGTLRPTVKLI